MKKNPCSLSILLTSFLLCCSNMVLASCDFLDASPQPDWVVNPNSLSEYYSGIGTAKANVDDFSAAIEQAKQNATKDVSSTIKVRVKSQLTVTQQLSGGGKLNEDFEEISSFVVDNSLEDVEVDSIWLDQEKCMLWTRVKVSKAKVKSRQNKVYGEKLLKQLESYLSETLDPNLAFESRLERWKIALTVKKQIPNKDVDKSKIAIAFTKLENVSAKLENDKAIYESGKLIVSEFYDEMIRYESAIEPSQRNKSSKVLNKLLRDLESLAPVSSQIGITEPILFKQASIEITRDEQCSAMTRLQKVIKQSGNKAYQKESKDILSPLSCSAAELKLAMMRAVFDGQEVRIWCRIDHGEQSEYWTKACDRMREVAVKLGAEISQSKVLPASVSSDFDNISKDLDPEGLDIILHAKGKIESRSNVKNPNGTDYRFNGKVNQALISSRDTIMIDRFSGLTGWNPVGESLAIDLLALNVVKRFQIKLSENIN